MAIATTRAHLAYHGGTLAGVRRPMPGGDMNTETVDTRIFTPRPDRAALLALYIVTFALHALTYAGYGFFRDEFYYLACGRHLAFGYVDHPPMVALVAAAVTAVSGESLLLGLRLVVAVAAGLTVAAAVALAGELGGGRYARVLAGLSAMLVPAFLGLFGVFSMNAFDLLAWAVLWWVAVRYLRTGNERLWLLFGVVAGLGLQNKVSVLFLGFGVAAGLLAAGHWRPFRRPWLYAGGLIAAAIFLPHVLWQMSNGWPTLEFMRNAMESKNVSLSPVEYLSSQALNTAPTLVVWLAGLWYLLFARGGRPFRAIGFAYLAVLAVMLATNAKAYYLVPAYTVLFAAGGVALQALRGRFAGAVRAVVLAVVVLGGIALAPFAKAILPVETFVAYAARLGVTPPAEERHRMGRLPQHFADMHGWRDLAATVAGVHAALPPGDRLRACAFAENYGQAGALEHFAREMDVPPAISGHNSYYLWGPGHCTGDILLVLGSTRERLLERFETVEPGAVFRCRDCMPYEDEKPVWIARGLRAPLAAAWSSVKHYN
jgi:hypothetical protein